MESPFSSKFESVCKVCIQQHNHLPRNQQKNHNKVVVRVGEKNSSSQASVIYAFPSFVTPSSLGTLQYPSKSSSTEMI